MSATPTIGTHSGSFHCDESLAVGMLRLTEQFADAPVVRTRDPAVLADLDIIVDVGGVYDPETHRYDHHQRGFEEFFDENHSTKLSSAGLVYKHFGKEVISRRMGDKLPGDADAAAAFVDMVWHKLYDGFIEQIDGIDNGIERFDLDVATPRYGSNGTGLSSRVGRLNPSWTEKNPDRDALFETAVEMATSEFLERVDHFGDTWLPARRIVEAAVDARELVDASGRILVLKEFCPWKSHLADLESERGLGDTIALCLFGDSSGGWRVQSVPLTPGSFENRAPLPEPWRGIRDQELSDLSGIPGCVFVHASGFIGGNETYDGALAMARKTLEVVDASDAN